MELFTFVRICARIDKAVKRKEQSSDTAGMRL